MPLCLDICIQTEDFKMILKKCFAKMFEPRWMWKNNTSCFLLCNAIRQEKTATLESRIHGGSGGDGEGIIHNACLDQPKTGCFVLSHSPWFITTKIQLEEIVVVLQAPSGEISSIVGGQIISLESLIGLFYNLKVQSCICYLVIVCDQVGCCNC